MAVTAYRLPLTAYRYLNGGEDISDEISRIESARGKVVMPKTGIGENNEHGFMSMFIDTEGNTVASHSIH